MNPKFEGEAQAQGSHPAPAQWMEWLYGEAPRREKNRLRRHLEACPDCQRQVARWRSVQRELHADALTTRTRFAPANREWAPALRWAAAAVLVLGIGFGLGRWSSPPQRELAQLRQELRAEWQADLSRTQAEWEQRREGADVRLARAVQAESQHALGQWFQAFARDYGRTRANDTALLLERLQKLERQRAAEYADMRLDLETLAVTTEGELRQTRRQLVGLMPVAEPETPTP